MAKNSRLTPAEWQQVMQHFKSMSPAELKQEHIRQTRQMMRTNPELRDQLQVILDRQQAELRVLAAAE
jgi:hypothetical protein